MGRVGRNLVVVAALAVAGALANCGGSTDSIDQSGAAGSGASGGLGQDAPSDTAPGGTDGTTGGAGANGNGGSGGSAAGGAGGLGGSGAAVGAGGTCAGISHRAEPTPTDIYVMFDQSNSMSVDAGGVTRWAAVTSAFQTFLQAPRNDGVSIGLQFFGRAAGAEDCNSATYAAPEVPIAALPGNANPLRTALENHQPVSETPTTAALAGAISFARSWKTGHGSRRVAVLLVTDGPPETPVSGFVVASCMENPQTIETAVAAAADGRLGSPAIRTYVIGVGSSLGSLDAIAAAGGTDQAYLASGSNPGPQVLDAFNMVRNVVALCQYQVPAPSGQQVPPDQVNVFFTPAGGTSNVVYNVPDAGACDALAGGWYYDETGATIQLCPATCQSTGNIDGELALQLYCPTQTAP